MSFKETDFPGLMGYLKRIVATEKDPELFKELVTQLVKMYDEVPLYPGIVSMCLGGVAKPANGKDVQVGQKVFIKNGDDFYSGTVSEKNDEGIVFKVASAVTSEEDLELEYGDMEKVTVLNESVLKEMWPSLVFEKD